MESDRAQIGSTLYLSRGLQKLFVNGEIQPFNGTSRCYQVVSKCGYLQRRFLLRRFVSACRSLYGDSFVSFKVHCLIHLANDVIRHGCLDKFSAFSFENKLQIIKNLVRKSGRPL